MEQILKLNGSVITIAPALTNYELVNGVYTCELWGMTLEFHDGMWMQVK